MTGTSGGLATTLSALPPTAVIESLWRELEQRAEASFFQSWDWIGTWLDCLPTGVAAELMRVERGSALVGLGILVRRTVVRHGLLRSRALFLNCTGDSRLDEITIEYNGFLAERGAEAEVARACIVFLLAERAYWDELFLDGMRDPELLDSLSLERASVIERSRRLCHYVDLTALRACGKEYLALLGRNTRYNLRRSLREYEKYGNLELHEATDSVEAHAYLQHLRHCHQRYWERKGEPGSFANEFFAAFHDKLLQRTFSSPNGAVQLLRVTAGTTELGYLYNFVHRGHVYNYQSGFDYTRDGLHDRPGMICHMLAIEHNLRKGHAVYDFMAGEGQLKRNLSTASQALAWQVVQRPRLKLRIEEAFRRVKRRLTRRAVSRPPNVSSEPDRLQSGNTRAS